MSKKSDKTIIKELNEEIEKLKKENTELEQELDSLYKQYTWIT